MSVGEVRRIVVGRVEEIPPGQRKLVVPFRGKAGIGVFNLDGRFYALRNLCPHKSGPLCTGFISGRMGHGTLRQMSEAMTPGCSA